MSSEQRRQFRRKPSAHESSLKVVFTLPENCQKNSVSWSLGCGLFYRTVWFMVQPLSGSPSPAISHLVSWTLPVCSHGT